MKIITLVGCGQIGIRHLQSLLNIKGPLLIQVAVRNEASMHLGMERISDLLAGRENITIEWHNSLDKLRVANLCIIATTAINRTDILLNLVERDNNRFLVEKIVCQSESDYLNLVRYFKKKNAKGWVNCYKRYYPFYKRIKNELKGSKHIIFKVTGGNLGLGCNAIHYLDLFDYFVDNPLIELNGNFLEDKIYENRRSKDLVEFCGTLAGKTINGDYFDITFSSSSKAGCTLLILGESISCFVDERMEKAWVALESKNWQWHSWDYKNLYVSQITADIATEIVDTDNCSLASLEDSYEYHRALFSAFNKHIKKLTSTSSNICPIT